MYTVVKSPCRQAIKKINKTKKVYDINVPFLKDIYTHVSEVTAFTVKIFFVEVCFLCLLFFVF